MKIFIGSSSEQIVVAKEIVRDLKPIIEHYDVQIELWKDWFDCGKFNSWSTWRVIQAAVQQFDLAIMLLAADDNVKSRDNNFTMTRDNVLIETGAFAVGIGMDNVIMLLPKELDYKLPSDFLGLNCMIFDYERGADNTTTYRKISEKIIEICSDINTDDIFYESTPKKIKNSVKKQRKPGGKLK